MDKGGGQRSGLWSHLATNLLGRRQCTRRNLSSEMFLLFGTETLIQFYLMLYFCSSFLHSHPMHFVCFSTDRAVSMQLAHRKNHTDEKCQESRPVWVSWLYPWSIFMPVKLLWIYQASQALQTTFKRREIEDVWSWYAEDEATQLEDIVFLITLSI